MWKLGNNANGPDEILAPLLKAGGDPLVIKLNALHKQIVFEEAVPYQWKGGRLVDLYKKKGNPDDCGNSRGLLISDHLAKGFVGILKEGMQEKLDAANPSDQYGGRTGGGTDYATYVVKSMIDYARVASMSIFVLFIDLVAACDKVVRELVFGWPHDGGADKKEYLTSIGIPDDAAEHFIHYIEVNGTVFEQMGVDQKITALTNCLRTRCWSKYGELNTCITSYTGGRQGCKLGSDVFKLVYMQAINVVRSQLRDRGIVFTANLSANAPWPGHCFGEELRGARFDKVGKSNSQNVMGMILCYFVPEYWGAQHRGPPMEVQKGPSACGPHIEVQRGPSVDRDQHMRAPYGSRDSNIENPLRFQEGLFLVSHRGSSQK